MAALTVAVLTVAVLTMAVLTMALLAMLYAVLSLALLTTPYYSGSSLQPHTASLQPSLQPHAVNLQQYCTSKSKPKALSSDPGATGTTVAVLFDLLPHGRQLFDLLVRLLDA